MIETIEGQLEIDSARGVIYFHSKKTGHTVLRIGNLPTPIPSTMLDIVHLYSTNWIGNQRFNKALQAMDKAPSKAKCKP